MKCAAFCSFESLLSGERELSLPVLERCFPDNNITTHPLLLHTDGVDDGVNVDVKEKERFSEFVKDASIYVYSAYGA